MDEITERRRGGRPLPDGAHDALAATRPAQSARLARDGRRWWRRLRRAPGAQDPTLSKASGSGGFMASAYRERLWLHLSKRAPDSRHLARRKARHLERCELSERQPD